MAGKNAADDGKYIKSVATAFDIVELLVEEDRMSAGAIAEKLGYSKSTVHYYLKTLERGGYVHNDGNGYEIGLRFLDPGGHAITRTALYDVARVELETLAGRTGQTAHAVVEQAGRGIYVYQTIEGNGTRRRLRIGTGCHLHANAYGKALLAAIPADRREELLDRRGLPAYTDRTITDREALSEELEAVVEHGIAFDDREHVDGVANVAVAVEGPSGDVAGAIGLTGPSDQLSAPGPNSKARRFAEMELELLQRRARQIESQLPERD